MKLLIIEDEPDMRNALKKGFIKKGYLVDTAEDGEEGSYLALVNTYDVIVLDLNLPGKDGLEILQEIRDRSKTQRVIILSARSSVPDKITGLDMGANDYLAKPFDFMELEARVRSLARREMVQNDTKINIHNLVIDTVQKKVSYNGEKIELTPKEYAILEYLHMSLTCNSLIHQRPDRTPVRKINFLTVSIQHQLILIGQSIIPFLFHCTAQHPHHHPVNRR